MASLQSVGTPQELEEYRLWREQKISEARQRMAREGERACRLTLADETALDRAWETLAQDTRLAENWAA